MNLVFHLSPDQTNSPCTGVIEESTNVDDVGAHPSE
jgi:hypothetical protein